MWSGGCSRFEEAPLRCWVGPSLGWPVAIPVAVVCASLAVLCVRRALRGRAAGTDPGDGDRDVSDPTPGRDA
ncbi:hypothetical protein [Clavibacter tessellarius]|uniref:hypothetical protein n=1 Tax=Clavibacter tessellarius TaxID=31965 RepID=UPI0032466653